MQLKKYLPSKDQLKKTRSLRFLGDLIFEPNLWHFNRHSLSFAALIGCVFAFLPIPFQMIPCVLICIVIRCNVPVAILLVWVSNPITYGPMMYFAYRVGLGLMGVETLDIPMERNFEWFFEQLTDVWQPLLIGCLACGFSSGIFSFTLIRFYYRWRIADYLKKRHQRYDT